MIKIVAFNDNEKMRKDIASIFSRLRKNDKKGLAEPAEESIQRHIDKASELYVVYDDEIPIAIFGLTDKYPVLGYKHQAFFIGSEIVDSHKKSFVKIGRSVICEWQRKYGRFYCFVWSYYKDSYKMIRAFGFKFKAILDDVDMFVKE